MIVIEKKIFEAHSLVSHIRTRGVCENFNMGIGQNNIHGNLSINSLAQANANEAKLCHGLISNSL
jgi:hypothetical protein